MTVSLRTVSPWRCSSFALLAAVSIASGARAADGDKQTKASSLEAGWQHGAFIEIFVRAYRDSDGDGIGDLRGLVSSLDYLQALGVRGIWLMPVTRSLDHDHGYAVSDYRDIEPAYGSLADFDVLLAQAHQRGIGVIMDYVINHGAADSQMFTAAKSSPADPMRDWFVWRDSAPSGWLIMGKDPWVKTASGAYLAQFSATMPEFNLLNPAVMAFHEGNLRFWLDRGVDGFRFDAVTHLVENGPDAWMDQPENYRLMHQVRVLVTSYPRRYMVCEVTRHATRYAGDEACGSAFALEQAPELAAAARGSKQAIRSVARYFRDAPGSMATMASNHDLFAGERLWDQVRGDQRQYRLAAATYLLQPGTPFIYYGEEVGMSSAAALRGDPKLRTPMSWSAATPAAGFSSVAPFRRLSDNVSMQNVASQEQAGAESLLAWYRELLRLRNRYPSIARGSYEAPFVQGRVMGFTRRLAGETTRILINYGRRSSRVRLRDAGAAENLAQVFPADGRPPRIVGSTVTIPAQSVLVLAAANPP